MVFFDNIRWTEESNCMSPRFRFNPQQFKSKLAGFLWKHWLDLVVVGVIITALLVLLWLRSQRQTQWIVAQVKVSQEEWWWQGSNPEYWYAQNLAAGTLGQNSFGETVAEIIKVELTDAGQARNQVQVWTKLKVSYDPKKDQYIYGFQPLQVGRGLELSFGSQQIKGLLIGLGQESPQTVERIVRVKMFQVDPQAAKAIVLGMENKNSVGEVLAKVTDLRVGQTVRSEFSDIRGRMILVSDPNFTQVEASIKMRLLKDGDKYISPDGQAIKIGGEATIQFPQVVMTRALILDISPLLPQ